MGKSMNCCDLEAFGKLAHPGSERGKSILVRWMDCMASLGGIHRRAMAPRKTKTNGEMRGARLRVARSTAFNRLLRVLLVVAAPLVAHAQFTFTTNSDGSLNLKQYTGPGGAVVIPSTTNGLTVTSIGINAFLNSSIVTNVTIPNSVISMGDYAFYNCTGLTNATIGNSLTNIGSQGFFGCTNLTSVTIPNGVNTIGKSAFFGCSKLLKVTIPNSVTNLGDYAFDSCSRMTNLTIGTNVTSVGYDAFLGCAGLTFVTIPNNVTNIGEEAFYSCLNLTNLAIGSKVSVIGTNAFYGCKGLRSIFIPTNVTSLADFAFGDCEGLTNVSLGNVTSIGAGAFYFCTSLPSVGIPRGLTNIANGAFNSCDSLTNITVDVVNLIYSSVGGVLFNKNQTVLIECPGGIRSYTIPTNTRNILGNAFADCFELRSVVIPFSVTNIGSGAFFSCGDLATVYCQGNAPSVSSDAFSADTIATVYYGAGWLGWGATFGGRPTVKLDPSLGTLQVTVSPPLAISSGAYWQVDGGAAQPSGGMITGLSVGAHTVSFSSLDGWATPYNQIVTISANSITTDTGVYGQLTWTTNSGAITITGPGPAGPGSEVILPGTIGGLPVTSIRNFAFWGRPLTSVTVPASVTNIGVGAFAASSARGMITVDSANFFYSSSNGVLFNKDQTTLVQYPAGVGGNYAIPQGVTSIGEEAFEWCSLTSVTIPNSVTNIGPNAFYLCAGLTSIVIPNSVTSIGDFAFSLCTNLTEIYFQGNTPSLGSGVFGYDNTTTADYLPGTTGWDAFGDIPAVLWNPQATAFIADGTQFGFNITGPTNTTIVVEACTDLVNPAWLPVSTNTLDGSGTSYFSDPQWTNYPARYYRFRSP